MKEEYVLIFKGNDMAKSINDKFFTVIQRILSISSILNLKKAMKVTSIH